MGFTFPTPCLSVFQNMSLRTCTFSVARLVCGVSSLFGDVLVWRRLCGLVEASVWISKVWAMCTGDLDCVVFVHVKTGPCDFWYHRVILALGPLWPHPCGCKKCGKCGLGIWIGRFLWMCVLVIMTLWNDRVTQACGLANHPCGFPQYGTCDLETWIVWFLWM